MLFSINFSGTFRSIGLRQGDGKTFAFPSKFFLENDTFECAYYFNFMNEFTATPLFGITSFVKAKEFLN